MTGYTAALRDAEARIGPLDGEGPLGPASTRARDEADVFDPRAVASVYAAGLGAWQIPRALGGELDSLEQLVAGAYVVSRRDASIALTVGLDVWSQLVWMAGSKPQRERVRETIDAGAGICLAASEREHGADLVATDTTADSTTAGLLLHGEKWPIGRATHSRLALVLARTETRPGPRSMSWLLVDLDGRSKRVRRLERVPTLGFRASDVSGLAFDGARLEPTSIVGERGHGLELALRLFQITRPLVASLALGPADTALRLATRFASDRQLYRQRAADLPAVRRALVRAWAQLVVAELLAVTCARTAHVLPSELVVASAATKVLVPQLARASVDGSAEVLGARFFFRDGFGFGLFQKALRDQLAVATFDGSTPVCLHGLGLQLPALLSHEPPDHADPEAIFDLDVPVPPLVYEDIGLTARGRDSVVQSSDAGPDRDALEVIRRRVREGLGRSAALLDLASDYAWIRARRITERAVGYRDPSCSAAVLPLAFGRRDVPSQAIDTAFERLILRVQSDAPLSGWIDDD